MRKWPRRLSQTEIFVSHLADHSSRFTDDARAIDLALEHIKKTNKKNYYDFLRFNVMTASVFANFTHKP